MPFEDAPPILQSDNSKKRGFVVIDTAKTEKEADAMLKTVKMEKGNKKAYITTEV